MTKPRNIIEKIWENHLILEREGHPALLAIDLMLIHEVTSAQAFDALRARKLKVMDPGRLLATLDHSIPTRKNRFEIFDDAARNQVDALRKNAKEFGVPLCDLDSGKQGIVHVIGPEMGLTQPGMTIVCGGSHTSTHGAFGALAFGIGASEVAHVLAAQCLMQRRPKTMRVNFSGEFNAGVYSKDAIMKLIAEIGISGGNGHVIEYCGSAVSAMSMEERMTICNMSIECGARAGLMAPDETTFDYLKSRPYAPTADKFSDAIQYWQSLCTDKGATFDRDQTIDVSVLRPMVTWGTNPEQAVAIDQKIPRIEDLPESHRTVAKQALDYVKLKDGSAIAGVPVEWAFLGSCTNGRIEDLRIAAKIIKGRKVKDGVTFYVVPGSEKVMAQAEREGLRAIFEEAGAIYRMPGCSMCLAMNDDKVPPGKRCISSSNRNFMGRQGSGSLTHLASPATVVASAIAGCITSPEQYL